tara:strand:- start:549 stop:740 length:192 start_codon:yes stop_codon:yes gene_type:complete
MSQVAWQVTWMIVLGAGLLGMAGLLVAVGQGSVRELRQSLDELRDGGEKDASEDVVSEPDTVG